MEDCRHTLGPRCVGRSGICYERRSAKDQDVDITASARTRAVTIRYLRESMRAPSRSFSFPRLHLDWRRLQWEVQLPYRTAQQLRKMAKRYLHCVARQNGQSSQVGRYNLAYDL